MFEVGQRCPEFHVWTPAGSVGSEEFRGAWLALLHCSRPCMPNCATCMQGFGVLASRLSKRACHLLVALDYPEAAVRSLMGRRSDAPGATWTLGTWQGPMEGAGGDTHFVVIDQDAIVKAMAQTPASGPIGAQMLLDLVDRAAGRPLSAASTAPRSDAAIGCVDWYHFEHDAR